MIMEVSEVVLNQRRIRTFKSYHERVKVWCKF
jgi:hypothetical protein